MIYYSLINVFLKQQLQFHMILQQNHIKIVQYTQKAFKIYCRRSLAGAIIKALQKKNMKDKQKYIDDDDYNLTTNSPKILSEKSIAYLSGGRQESVDGDSATSQMKKTVNNAQKNDKNKQKVATVLDRLQIMYGDLVYIQFNPEDSGENMRAKHFLNKLKFCSSQVVGVGSSSDLRCVFQIVYPGADLENQKKGTLVTQSSLICLRTISKKQYLKVKGGKIVYSDQFGKQLQLTKQLNQCCVFQLKYAERTFKEQIIVSGQQIVIKMFGQDLYMNVLKNQQQIFFSQAPAIFTLKKLKKKLQNFVPTYFKMKSNKFQTNILANPIDLQPISQKKTMINVLAINQNNVENKINPITFVYFDFSKIPQQDFKITNNVHLSSNNVLNCWELIQCFNKSENNLYHLYNPMVGLGLTIKPLKNVVKLTSNQQDFSVLRVSHKDDDIISFSLQQSAQELDIIYDRIAQKYVIVLYKAESQNNSKLFKTKHINTNSAYMICQMTQIFDVLKNVYEFLNTWGNQFDEKSQTVFYSVKQIKLGSSIMLKKIRQMRMVFKILKNYLQNPEYSVQQIQNTINSMKILEMIINICKIITNKIGYTYPFLQQDTQSPFCFAKNNLQDILKSMFVIILKLTKDNIPNSTAVISQVNFFNNILRSYPQQIGEILQQSIKNLSVFSTKTNTNGSNELFIWVKLIQPIREDTIKIQKTYIQIIAEAVIDPSDRGIPQYQNKCKQLLFIQNSKRKVIPKFGIGQKQKAIIMFQNYFMQFYQMNNYLRQFNLPSHLIQSNSLAFEIQKFFLQKSPCGDDISLQYVGYISSIIKMFRNLCRNRNKKLFKIVDDWGITQQHIQAVFNSPDISWELKTNYLSLWTAVYIDEDPFLPFQKRQSKCHFWPKIHKYNLQDCTALIFKQYTDESQAISKLNDFGPKIYPILSQYLHYFKRKLPNVLGDISELKCLLIVLNTIYQMMDLGYMTLKSMKDNIGIVLHLLSGLEQGMFAKRANQQQLMKFHHSILIKFIRILIMYEDIWVEIYGIQLLQNFYKEAQNKNYTMSRQLMEQKWQNIIKNKFEQNHDIVQSKPHTNRKRTRFNAFSQTQTSLLAGRGDHLNFQNQLSFQQIDNQISDFTINLLTKRMLQHKCQSHQQLINLMNKKISRRQRVCEYLKQIMILNNEREQEIYRNFSGRQSNKLLNWLKIQQIVHKISNIQSNNSNDEVQLRSKKQKVLQLNNILIKIIRQMKAYKSQNLKMLRKCQLILQKLRVHTILMDLLKFSQKPAYKDLMKTIFQFFCQFMADNQFNCKALVPHTDKFIKNLNYQGLVYILPTLISISDNKQLAYKIAYELVFKITQNQTNVYILMIFDKLLNLNPGSQQTHQLKNHLSRRIIEQFKLKTTTSLQEQAQNQIQNQMGQYQSILNSFQFTKILCKLSSENPQLEKYIKFVNTKCGLLEKLKDRQNYDDKKLYLKILAEIYIRNKQLQNFEIEDYFEMLILNQLKKLPHICIKLVQQNSINYDQQNQINSLYEDLKSFSNSKITTKDQQTYLNFILDFNDISQISILSFAKIIISKWKGQQKSMRLQRSKNYFKKLQQFLYLIFYIKNSTYQRNIFEQIQAISVGLQNIVVESHPQQKWQRRLDQTTKDEVVKFYNTLAKIIVQQDISTYSLFQCFKIDPQRMQMKRSNYNITQSQFVQCLNRLKKLVKKQQEYKSIMESVQLFRFISVNKDAKTKMIDINFIMDKLISLMQYNKNIRIKKQIPSKKSQAQNPSILQDNEQQQIQQNTVQNINSYMQNQQVNQKQFSLQVYTFCELSQKYKQIIIQNMNRRIKQSVCNLKKKKIIEWIKDNSMNIFNISQHYQCSLLYTFLLSILDRAVQIPYQINIINQQLIVTIVQYLKSINNRFKTTINSKYLLILYNEILNKFNGYEQIIQKIQKVTQRGFDIILNIIITIKRQQNMQLLKYYKILYINIINNQLINEVYRMRMKYKMMEMIKKLISRGINLSCLYDYRIMQGLLLMWSQNQLNDQVENSALIQDIEFIRWVQKILSKKSLLQMIGTNSKNINKSKFALLIVKEIIKYQENHQNHHITISKSIAKIQQSACQLFQQFVMPKKQAHAQQLYCLNYNQCSQFFCNYQKLTSHDQNILNLLLSLFIITRIYLIKSQNYAAIAQMKQKTNIDYKIRGLVGHIKYRMYEKDKNYNFKLPSCHLFTNNDIQQNIINQIIKIPSQNLYMYLHPLSKVFGSELHTISILNNKFKPFLYIISHKNLIKKITLIIFTLLLCLELNKIIINPHQNSKYSNHPAIQIICLWSFFIYLIYYILQIRLFKNYCTYYYPIKYSHITQQIDQDTINNYLFQKNQLNINNNYNTNNNNNNNNNNNKNNQKQQNNKNITNNNNQPTSATKKDLSNQLPNQINSSQNININIKNNTQTDKLPLNKNIKTNKSLSFKQLLIQLAQSSIPLHTILLVVYILGLFNTAHLVVLVILQIFDLQTTTKLMKAFKRALAKIFLQHMFMIIVIDFSFIYISDLPVYRDLHFVQLLKAFMIKFYAITFGGDIRNLQSESDIPFLQISFQIVFFVNIVLYLFFISQALFCYKKQTQNLHNKCWICLKNKNQIQKKQKFKYHLSNQHKLWDYMYFFIEFDRKGKLEGIGTQIQQQIAKEDYRFLKLH